MKKLLLTSVCLFAFLACKKTATTTYTTSTSSTNNSVDSIRIELFTWIHASDSIFYSFTLPHGTSAGTSPSGKTTQSHLIWRSTIKACSPTKCYYDFIANGSGLPGDSIAWKIYINNTLFSSANHANGCQCSFYY